MKKRERFRAKPAPEFLRLRDPGAGKHRAGDQPVPDVRIKILRARAQPFEMKRGALNHGDEIGGRTGHVGPCEFDHPVHLQGARDLIDGGNRARLGGAREITAEPCDAQSGDPILERRRCWRCGHVGLRRIPSSPPSMAS